MENSLKKKVLNKIKEVYPKLDGGDLIVLYGSRATGFSIATSDIDVVIITNKKNYLTKQSIKKGFRKPGEDTGFEIKLDNGLSLEVKIESVLDSKRDVFFYYAFFNAVPLSNVKKFNLLQNSLKKEFKENYENFLLKEYVNFFNEFKKIEGISKRKDELSKINLAIKKSHAIQSLLRLMIIINKKPYPIDKFLAHEAAKLADWKSILKIIKNMDAINSYETYTICKNNVKVYVNYRMPKRDYVGAWWKYLKQFRKIE